MKTAIVYISIHHGNTEKIAEEMAKVFEASLFKVEEADPDSLSEFDLLGFGSGIYHYKHHKKLLELIKRLPIMEGKKAFIFSTAGVNDQRIERDRAKNHAAMRNVLTDKRFDIIGDFSCCGFMTWGWYKLSGGRNKSRPSQSDLEKAATFAKALKTEITNQPHPPIAQSELACSY